MTANSLPARTALIYNPDAGTLAVTIHCLRKRLIRVMLDGELHRLQSPLHDRLHPQALTILKPLPNLLLENPRKEPA